MAKNITEVVIAGKIISISGEEDAAYMTEVAAFINNKLLEYLAHLRLSAVCNHLQGS